MEYAVIIIFLALLQYMFFSFRVGMNRDKHDIKAPKTVVNDQWECMYRVHQNTLEQLIIFIPAMLGFQHYMSQTWVILPGVLFLLGRQYYSHQYTKNPEARVPGMVIGFLSNVSLILGSLIGIAMVLAA